MCTRAKGYYVASHALHKMLAIVTCIRSSVVGLSVCVCVCVCLLVTFVRPAKTAEPMEMPFGADSCGSKESCFRGASRSTTWRGNFQGLSGPPSGVFGVSCAKTAEPIEMSFWGSLTWVQGWGQDQMNSFATGRDDTSAMRPFVKILWPIVLTFK